MPHTIRLIIALPLILILNLLASAPASASPTLGTQPATQPSTQASMVYGKIILPSKQKIDTRFCQVTLYSLPDYMALNVMIPKSIRALPYKAQPLAYKKWEATPAGKQYIKAIEKLTENIRHYTADLKSDGSYVFKNIPAGAYGITCTNPYIVNNQKTNDLIAQYRGRIDTVGKALHKVKTIRLREIIEPRLGQMAPIFKIKTIYGKDFDLKKLRGKFVLLDFWAVWCDPCKAETPYIKAAYEKFGGKNFEVVALSSDSKRQAPIKYAKQHGLKYTQGFLGRNGQTNVSRRYGVRGIPSIWLINPRGIIIAKQLRGEKIQQAIAKALARDTNK